MEAWLTPSVILALVAGAAGLVGWLIRQDRRIAKAEDLEAKLFGSTKEPGWLALMEQRLVGQLERYQTREHCGDRERKADEDRRESVARAHEAIRALEDRVVAGEKSVLELGGDLKATRTSVEDLKSMLRQLSKDVAQLSLAIRGALPRKKTGELPNEE